MLIWSCLCRYGGRWGGGWPGDWWVAAYSTAALPLLDQVVDRAVARCCNILAPTNASKRIVAVLGVNLRRRSRSRGDANLLCTLTPDVDTYLQSPEVCADTDCFGKICNNRKHVPVALRNICDVWEGWYSDSDPIPFPFISQPAPATLYHAQIRQASLSWYRSTTACERLQPTVMHVICYVATHVRPGSS